MVYGFDVSKNIIRTMGIVKYAKQCTGGVDELPENITEGIRSIETKLKGVLALLISSVPGNVSVGNDASAALSYLLEAVQSTDEVSWNTLEKHFSSINWSQEKTLIHDINEQTKNDIITMAKHVSFEAHLLERDVEKFLVAS